MTLKKENAFAARARVLRATPGAGREYVSVVEEHAKRGAVWALNTLGVEYSEGLAEGDGEPLVYPDFRKAANYFVAAAELGDTDAMISLSSLFELGNGVKRDAAKALHWQRLAARKGNSNAMFNVAVFYRDQGRHSLAVTWFRKSARCGQQEALLELAVAEVYGLGVRRNVGAALRTLNRLAASKRVAPITAQEACIFAARLYMEGWVRSRSYLRAERWLERGVASGSLVCQEMLADLRG